LFWLTIGPGKLKQSLLGFKGFPKRTMKSRISLNILPNFARYTCLVLSCRRKAQHTFSCNITLIYSNILWWIVEKSLIGDTVIWKVEYHWIYYLILHRCPWNTEISKWNKNRYFTQWNINTYFKEQCRQFTHALMHICKNDYTIF
jgi:hypothetical protein